MNIKIQNASLPTVIIQAHYTKTDILVDMYNRNKPGHITYLYIYRNS